MISRLIQFWFVSSRLSWWIPSLFFLPYSLLASLFFFPVFSVPYPFRNLSDCFPIHDVVIFLHLSVFQRTRNYEISYVSSRLCWIRPLPLQSPIIVIHEFTLFSEWLRILFQYFDCSVTLFDIKKFKKIGKLFTWNSESMEFIWSTDYRATFRFRSQISFFLSYSIWTRVLVQMIAEVGDHLWPRRTLSSCQLWSISSSRALFKFDTIFSDSDIWHSQSEIPTINRSYFSKYLKSS